MKDLSRVLKICTNHLAKVQILQQHPLLTNKTKLQQAIIFSNHTILREGALKDHHLAGVMGMAIIIILPESQIQGLIAAKVMVEIISVNSINQTDNQSTVVTTTPPSNHLLQISENLSDRFVG